MICQEKAVHLSSATGFIHEIFCSNRISSYSSGWKLMRECKVVVMRGGTCRRGLFFDAEKTSCWDLAKSLNKFVFL